MFPVSRWTLARGHRRVNYRPQTKFAKVMFSQVSVCLQADTPEADITTPQAETPLGRHPTCPVHAGIHAPCPVHAGIHTPLSSACWDKHPPPPPSTCWDTVNKRAVRIPLECILVNYVVPSSCIRPLASAFRTLSILKASSFGSILRAL